MDEQQDNGIKPNKMEKIRDNINQIELISTTRICDCVDYFVQFRNKLYLCKLKQDNHQ